MIREDTKKLTTRSIITKVCDDCGKEEKKNLAEVIYSRSRKRCGKDYCKKCAYKNRVIPDHGYKKSPHWKGGRTLTKNGYYRISYGDNQGKYEHRVIYENFINRRLKKKEKIHHVDGNKLNNQINNLFLCENKKEHSLLHHRADNFIMSLLNKHIYFNRENKKYTTLAVKNNRIDFIFDDSEIKSIIQFAWKAGGKEYQFGYLGDRKHKAFHRIIYEQFIDRKLDKNEHIHHIDGDTLNNEINNLILLTRKEHKECHNSLWDCLKILYESGIIRFNNGDYCLCQSI